MSRTYSSSNFLSCTCAVLALAALAMSATTAQATHASFSDNFDSYTSPTNLGGVGSWINTSSGGGDMRALNTGSALSPSNVAIGRLGTGESAYRPTGIDTNVSEKLVFEGSLYYPDGSSDPQFAVTPTTVVTPGSNGWFDAASTLGVVLNNTANTLEFQSTNGAGATVGSLSAAGFSSSTWYDVRITTSGLLGAVNATLEYKLSSIGTYTTLGTILTDGSWGAGNFGIASVGAGSSGALDNISVSTQIPEPSTIVMLGLGLVGLCSSRRRRRGSAS